MTDSVEYRPIEGFRHYRVGSDGSVWSMLGGVWRQLKGRPLKNRRVSRPRKGAYLSVVLCEKPLKSQRLIHRIVLAAFVGPCPDGAECRHLDGDPQNNRLENLAWGTRTENIEDMRRHGSLLQGEAKAASKLTEEDVLAIWRLSEHGCTPDDSAKLFGVSPETIKTILSGDKWKHVAAKWRART